MEGWIGCPFLPFRGDTESGEMGEGDQWIFFLLFFSVSVRAIIKNFTYGIIRGIVIIIG